MNFKITTEQYHTANFWDDVFEGYIIPENLLEEADATKIRVAIELLEQFQSEVIDKGLVQYL